MTDSPIQQEQMMDDRAREVPVHFKVIGKKFEKSALACRLQMHKLLRSGEVERHRVSSQRESTWHLLQSQTSPQAAVFRDSTTC